LKVSTRWRHFLIAMVRFRVALFSVFFVCCGYASGGERDDEPGDSGEMPDSSGGRRDSGLRDADDMLDGAPGSGCNPATGMGCTCGTCPQASDTCVSFGGGDGGGFCSNTCTRQDQQMTCALLPGQPGTSVCGLGLPGSSMADHCFIMCDSVGNCPAGMVHPPMMSPCICQGP
jgi:hypothetical protein